jgi:hypothetical protein
LAEDRHLARLTVLAIGAVWCLLPVLLLDRTAEDAVPILVAGDLIDEAPEQIYSNGLKELGPLNRAKACAFYDTSEACEASGTAFLSTPAVIPVAGVLAMVPDDVGLALMRVLAVAAAVGSLALLWRDHGSKPGLAPAAVALSALALTPIVMYCVGLGQTSSLFLLAAVAGAPSLAGRGLVAAAAWGGLIALKLFPGIAVVGVRGRRGVAATCAVALALVVLALVGGMWAGWERFDDYVTATRAIANDARETASSGGLETVARDVVGRDLAPAAALVARAILAVGLVAACRRVRDRNVTWAAALFFSVIVVPQVWTHYLFVVPGLGAAAAGRAGVRALVLGSVATVPALLALGAGGLSLTYKVAVTLVVAEAVFVVWAYTLHRPQEDAEDRVEVPSGTAAGA